MKKFSENTQIEGDIMARRKKMKLDECVKVAREQGLTYEEYQVKETLGILDDYIRRKEKQNGRLYAGNKR